jgi:hypothetical protein
MLMVEAARPTLGNPAFCLCSSINVFLYTYELMPHCR